MIILFFKCVLVCLYVSLCVFHRIIEWLGFEVNLKDHLVPTSLPWAGTPSTRPSCSKPHPAWPWTLLGTGHLQLLWATCSSVSPPPFILKNFFLISGLNLPSFSLKPLPLVLSLHALVKSSSPAFLQAPSRYRKAAVRSPQSLLFCRLNSPNSLSRSS